MSGTLFSFLQRERLTILDLPPLNNFRVAEVDREKAIDILLGLWHLSSHKASGDTPGHHFFADPSTIFRSISVVYISRITVISYYSYADIIGVEERI